MIHPADRSAEARSSVCLMSPDVLVGRDAWPNLSQRCILFRGDFQAVTMASVIREVGRRQDG